MNTFKTLALLLTYPQPYWFKDIGEIEETLASQCADTARRMRPWFDYVANLDLLDLQEEYVFTFDTRSAHSLYLTEHTHGDTRDRGMLLAGLVDRYRAHGLEIIVNELPDYLPLFLEFLATLPDRDAYNEFAPYIPAVKRIRERLEKAGSSYKYVFFALENLAASRKAGDERTTMSDRAPQGLFHKARDKVAAAFSRRLSHDVL